MDLRDLPKSLQKAIEDMEGTWAKVDQGEDCPYWDCFFCELQSSINSAEVNGVINSEMAWYLRKKYLRMERPVSFEKNIIYKRRGIGDVRPFFHRTRHMERINIKSLFDKLRPFSHENGLL